LTLKHFFNDWTNFFFILQPFSQNHIVDIPGVSYVPHIPYF